MTTVTGAAQTPPRASDTVVVDALRRGDEAAFRALVETHHPGMRRVARMYAPPAVIDDVLQETWLGVVHGISRFDGRSSLKTWIYRILLNQARKHGLRERRTVPHEDESLDRVHPPAVPPGRLLNPILGPGYWSSAPPNWEADPEDRAEAAEMRDVVATAIRQLPNAQRDVITLRDVEGWPADEVCDALRISAVNQRVLLHRARTSVRTALEVYFHAE